MDECLIHFKFLQDASDTDKYSQYIFTAAIEVYASPVLNILDSNGVMFRHRFTYDKSLCVHVKDLGIAFDKIQNKETSQQQSLFLHIESLQRYTGI